MTGGGDGLSLKPRPSHRVGSPAPARDGQCRHNTVESPSLCGTVALTSSCSLCVSVQDATTLRYEELLLRDSYSVKQWLAYLLYQHDATAEVRAPRRRMRHGSLPRSSCASHSSPLSLAVMWMLQKRYLTYERAVAVLPTSYKLWRAYLTERTTRAAQLPPSHPHQQQTCLAFERCLSHLHTMPALWLLYCTYLSSLRLLTATRHTFDRALSSLPLTQHQRWVWPAYLDFVLSTKVPETIVRVYRRYIKLDPAARDTLVTHLTAHRRWDDAALLLIECINDPHYISAAQNKSKYDLWTALLSLLLNHPTATPSIDTPRLIRSALSRYANDAGRLYVALAGWYVKRGELSRARDVYEEAVTSVGTVRDFTQVFDAYGKLLETIVVMRMQQFNDRQQQRAEAAGEEGEGEGEEAETDLDLSILRLEDLLNRRPLLLSSVLLRQNPHNVDEWLKRISLYSTAASPHYSVERTVETYTEAVLTINPSLATGEQPLSAVWSSFARFYLDADDVDNARVIYGKAVTVPYKRVDELLNIVCEWVELEIKRGELTRARDVLARLCKTGGGKRRGGSEELAVQEKAGRSSRLWSLYADIEENIGTLTTTRAVYDAMLQLRVITPQLCLSYAQLLTDGGYYEDSFRVYERCIALFHYPHVLLLWLAYLHSFIARFRGTKRERTRDLFEQCVATIPAEHARKLYLLYGKWEEDHGLARRAMDVYYRGCIAVPPKQRYAMYVVYIARVTARFGLTRAREVYEEAIRNVSDTQVVTLALAYARLERRLGEVDRARAVYVFASQWADASTVGGARLWREWDEFEVESGNEDTYREMLRVKRTVAAAYAGVGRRRVGEGSEDGKGVEELMSEKLIDGPKKKRRRTGEASEADGVVEGNGDSRGPRPVDDDAEQDGEREAREGSEEGVEDGRPFMAANPEEINIDDVLDDDEDEEVQPEEADGEADKAGNDDDEEEDELERAGGLEDGLDGDDDMAGLVQKPIPASLFGQAAV